MIVVIQHKLEAKCPSSTAVKLKLTAPCTVKSSCLCVDMHFLACLVTTPKTLTGISSIWRSHALLQFCLLFEPLLMLVGAAYASCTDQGGHREGVECPT